MNHIDCRNYLATDVFKGICKRDKNNILADDASCEHYENVAKCRHCSNYSPQDEYLGKCKETAMAYAEMTAFTCTEFDWKYEM